MGRFISQLNLFFEHLPERLRQNKIMVIALCTALTLFLAAGIGRVTIDESMDSYFRNDDPVKMAYDRFKTIFGSDEYLYIVYQAKDGDIFSDPSLKALKGVHDELVNYRLVLKPGEASALDHIEEVKSLINVKYMEARDETLYSRNFIGDQLPESEKEREILRQKALNHPDYPHIYLSRNSEYGGIMIRTDFNAERMDGIVSESGHSTVTSSGFDDENDDVFEMDVSTSVLPDQTGNEIQVKKTDMTEYTLFMQSVKSILENESYGKHLTFYPVGNPVMMDFFMNSVMQEMGKLICLVLVLIIIMLWFLFRSFSAVVWPSVLIVLTIVWTLGIIGWSGIPMSSMIQIIVFLVLAVGVADSVHILSGYLYFRQHGQDHKNALVSVMKKSGLACFLTSTTTSIGLTALILVPLQPISNFGIFAAVGVLLAFFFTVFILPLMLDLWNPVAKKNENKDSIHPVQKLIRKIEHVSMSRPGFTISVFVISGVILIYGLLQLKVDSNFVEVLKKGLPIRNTYTIVDQHMGGTGNLEILVDLKQEDALMDPDVLFKMEALQSFMETKHGDRVIKTMSLVNVVKDSYKALNNDNPDMYRIPGESPVLKQTVFLFGNANPKDRRRLVSDDYSKARIGINTLNVGSIEGLSIMNSVQEFIDESFAPLKQTYPDLEITLTGNMGLLAIMLDYISWSQIKSFGLALCVISVVLLLVLGSFKAGAIAIVPNLFPILTTFGLMGYFGIPLDADTLLIAPLIIGLAVDDTIHFLTHFRLEMAKSGDIRKAVVSSIREAGQAITFTSLILSIGFCVFILSFHNGLSHFGIFAAVAIMTALISDLFFLPALCKLFSIDFRKKGKQRSQQFVEVSAEVKN